MEMNTINQAIIDNPDKHKICNNNVKRHITINLMNAVL